MPPAPAAPILSPEHLQLLSADHLAAACADAPGPARPGSPRGLVGTALVRNARFEMRRRTCSVPVRDRYGDAPAAR